MVEHLNIAIPNSVRFWLLLVTIIPSICCSLSILYHIFSNRNRRHSINNHVIILLLINNLIYEVINIPLYLNYYRLNVVSPATPGLCLTWIFIHEVLYTISTVIVAWASVERHMLIFHERWFSTARGRFLFHYTPIVVLITYIVVFHFVVIILPPCQNVYDYTLEICGNPLCYHDTPLIGTWDNIVHGIMPTMVIVIFSVSLLIRVLRKNYRMRKAFQWRKHRKMTIQLLSISLLYVLLYIPGMSVELAQLCCSNTRINADFEEYAGFFLHYVIFLLPFVYIISLIEGSWKIKTIVPCWPTKPTTAQPLGLHTTHVVPQHPLPKISGPPLTLE